MRFDGLRGPKQPPRRKKFSSAPHKEPFPTTFTSPPLLPHLRWHIFTLEHPRFFPAYPICGRSFPRSFYSRRNYRSLGGMRLGPPSWLVLDLTELPIYPGIIIPAHIARAFPTVLEESGEFIKKFPRGRASGEAARARARI